MNYRINKCQKIAPPLHYVRFGRRYFSRTMDIDTIKRKRKKSVQDQNAILKWEILATARWWLEGNKLPKPIESLASGEGITRDAAILIDSKAGPICCEHSYSGGFLSANCEFWFYDVDLNDDETKIEHIQFWGKKDIEVSAHKKGTGKTFGFLCLEVLNETKK